MSQIPFFNVGGPPLIPQTADELGLDRAALTKAVWAYDRARCRLNTLWNGSDCAAMSEANARSIAPMIGEAVLAYIKAISEPSAMCKRCGCMDTDPIHIHGCTGGRS